ncbi:hypothetical protein HETIRDRAFT_482638 [Heterobasidion irregulare TC 32-1]|uniref:Arrestin C-terminal-like domain-containing protein n=1 Tax=Heterobasidion irregulare (strain TC 32-1) TaxID=747525 RepID=W4JP39_HETIT|nr:uncharacterized protein HETIRDRAFT_482638 [Heterobasidion irregulare TC 32-1]ETW74835.1 hypothetical protein HETIRDRAFT_482638 [Heterobasidion irregulare TC 32-1]
MTTKTHKNNLSICLTESVVFLRSSDFTGRRHSASDVSPALLRGLLTLNLVKPTRISSIEIELQGKSATSWPEGVGARRTEVTEEHKIFSATQVFFRAPSTPSSSIRRALSVGPGLSFYRDELEHTDSSPERDHDPDSTRDRSRDYFTGVPRRQTHAPDGAGGVDEIVRRGRDTARRRLSADRTIFQRDPVLHRTNSRSPTPLYTPPMLSPPSQPAFAIDSVPPTPRSGRSSTSHFLPLHRMEEIPSDLEFVPRDANRSQSRTPAESSASSFRSHLDTSLSRPVSIDEDLHSHAAERSMPVSPVRGSREPSTDRGRKVARFSLSAVSNVILDAVKERVRSSSPRTFDRGASVDQREASRGRTFDKGKGKEKEKEKESTWSHLYHTKEKTTTAFGKVGEVLGLDLEEHKEFGDGWREYKAGTYTFPISFAIPLNMPPSLECDYGSVSWRLKAQVHRPGAFTTKLTALRDVVIVASPSDDDTEDTENIIVERFWDNQLQYLLSISGRMFHIGGTIPIHMSFLPMAKMKIHRLSVILEERVDYYVQMKRSARSEQTNRFALLMLKNADKNGPSILPLVSDDPLAFMDSPLHALLGPDDDASEMASSLMGPGPWSFHTTLKLPTACGLLHFTNKNRKSNIQIAHTLKIVIRVERGDDLHIDPKTGKRKLFDIVVQTPVHILSASTQCLCNSEHTSLPRYSEALEESFPQVRSCACPVKRRKQSVVPPSPPSSGLLERTISRMSSDSGASLAEVTAAPHSRVGTLFDQNVVYERLITGQQSESGEAPPAYVAVARPTMVVL